MTTESIAHRQARERLEQAQTAAKTACDARAKLREKWPELPSQQTHELILTDLEHQIAIFECRNEEHLASAALHRIENLEAVGEGDPGARLADVETTIADVSALLAEHDAAHAEIITLQAGQPTTESAKRIAVLQDTCASLAGSIHRRLTAGLQESRRRKLEWKVPRRPWGDADLHDPRKVLRTLEAWWAGLATDRGPWGEKLDELRHARLELAAQIVARDERAKEQQRLYSNAVREQTLERERLQRERARNAQKQLARAEKAAERLARKSREAAEEYLAARAAGEVQDAPAYMPPEGRPSRIENPHSDPEPTIVRI